MKKINLKIILSLSVFLAILFGSILLIRIKHDNSFKPPYTIGSPVIDATQMPAGMVMKSFEVKNDEPVPTISLDIIKDSMGGYDIHATTNNFTFAPEHLNGEAVPGEGHVHLYIDENLIIMLDSWYHIDSLTPGTHNIRVGLFNNDHSAYSIDGKHIEDQKQIEVSALGQI